MRSTFNQSSLPETIPVFPLSGVILFSRCILPLTIFEPRYVSMLSDSLRTDHRLIGMIQPNPEAGHDRELYDVGCAGQITHFRESANGRYRIMLTGISRFRLRNLIEGFTPYLRASPAWSEFESDLESDADDPGFAEGRFVRLVKRYFSTSGIDLKFEDLDCKDEYELVNRISMFAQLSVADKQALLELPTLAERRRALELLLNMEIFGGKELTLQ